MNFSIVPHYFRLRNHDQQERNHSIPGIPEGCPMDLLQEVAGNAFRSPILGVSHTHLSGWKRAGAYRLFLRLENGAAPSLVYKVARYGYDEIPALRELPIRPGLPEFLIFRLPKGPLTEFLPAVYWAEEIRTENTFRYLCEDLGVEHYLLSRSPRVEKDILFAVARLPLLHEALEKSLGEDDRRRLLRFDRKFAVDLLEYAYTALRTYEEKIPDSVIRNILNRWSEVEGSYIRGEFFDGRSSRIIHGDLNASNIYISKIGKKMKVVDWEWAGFGVPHADLVSLLQGCDRQIRHEALELYCSQVNGLSMLDHKRFFHWCRLGRGLLDAAFLARQQLESQRRVDWIPDRILRGIHDILTASNELA